MDPESQKKFDAIVKKKLHELLTSDIVFLKARRVYLTPEQEKTYASVLETHQEKQPKGSMLSRYHELMKQAKVKGITVPKGTKIDELELMVS